MLVNELKDILKKYRKEDLAVIIVEMYKAIPKSVKEDKEIDNLIEKFHEVKNNSNNKRKAVSQVNIDSLSNQINIFAENAYAQNYFAPNRNIHKKERSKWRFLVKSFIKDLQNVPNEGDAGMKATELLKKLYDVLCYGCSYTIFSTDEPFRAVGIGQSELLDIIISRKLMNGVNRESIKFVIETAINSRVDGQTVHSELILELIKNLKTTDAKEMAIEMCSEVKNELISKKLAITKKSSYGLGEYEWEEKMNNITEMVFRIMLELAEYQQAIKYFDKNYLEKNKGVLLYVKLHIFIDHSLKELWISEYESAVNSGIEPRDSLRRTYEYIKANGDFPEYIYL